MRHDRATQLERVEGAAGQTRLPIIDRRPWIGQHPPERDWMLEGWIPSRRATLLTGRGGVGKSLLAQQLSTCIALGRAFLGQQTQRARALYLTAEDDAEELWRRQVAICRAVGCDLDQLEGQLFLSTLVAELGNDLASFDQQGRLQRSERYRQLVNAVDEFQIGFVVVDNASHAMAGDHNDLQQVAAFIGLLNSLAVHCGGGVLLLHHPNKAGDEWLGSVSWETQVRSRLVLHPSDREGDRDARWLNNPKANYAADGARIDLRWRDGAFISEKELEDDERENLETIARASADNDIFLACLAERNRQMRPVSERFSRSYAPTVFAAMSESHGIGKARLEAAMDRLFRCNRIERAQLGRDKSKGRDIEGLREVENLTPNSPKPYPQTHSRTVPEPTPKPSQNPTPNPPPHTPIYPTDILGAALGAAAPNLVDIDDPDAPDSNPGWSDGLLPTQI